MDLLLMLLKLVPLLAVCAVGPGLAVMGRFRWSPVERLCGVFAVSFCFIYLCSFGLFLLNVGAWGYWLVSGICALLGMAGWKTARALLRRSASRKALFWLAAVLGWELMHLAMVQHFDGGNWGGDWHEQMARTTYFLHELPWDTMFLNRYPLTSRPPMMNLIAAFFCRQAGVSFVVFNLVYLFLNGWAFLPCCALLRLIAPRQRGLSGVLAMLFMLNPSILENATFTWTKAFTAGLVVLGTTLYARRLRSRKDGKWRELGAAGAFSAGVLAHYSAAPYALAVALHWGWQALRRRALKEAIASAAVMAVLLGPWFVWAAIRFGPAVTVGAPAVTTGTFGASIAQDIERYSYDLFASIVPHPFHPGPEARFERLRTLAEWRNYYFMMSQTTLPMMIGVSGGLIAAWLLWRSLRRGQGFWIYFLAVSTAVGLAVHNDWTPYGCADITMQPLAMMGLTLIAGRIRELGRGVLAFLIAGLAVDYAWGIFLQFFCQNLPYKVVFTHDGILKYQIFFGNLSVPAMVYGDMLRVHYLMLGDYVAGAGTFLQGASIIGAAAMMVGIARAALPGGRNQ